MSERDLPYEPPAAPKPKRGRRKSTPRNAVRRASGVRRVSDDTGIRRTVICPRCNRPHRPVASPLGVRNAVCLKCQHTAPQPAPKPPKGH